MIDEFTVFIMITGGFGHCVTPMIWSLFGEAITRWARSDTNCPIFQFVDDTFGAGTYDDAKEAQLSVRDKTIKIIGPNSISEDKSEFGQCLVILDSWWISLGILSDLKTRQ